MCCVVNAGAPVADIQAGNGCCAEGAETLAPELAKLTLLTVLNFGGE